MISRKKRPAYFPSATKDASVASESGAFLPESLYCRECSSCTDPPSQLNSQHQQLQDQLNCIGDDNGTNVLRFRVHSTWNEPLSATEHELKTTLMTLPEVIDVRVKSSMVIVEYKCSSFESSVQHERNKVDPINATYTPLKNSDELIQDIMRRLSEAKYDCEPLVKNENRLSTIERNRSRDGRFLWKLPPSSSMQTTFCRSSFHVSGICCSSEIPTVQSILTPLSSVRRVRVNVITKVVYVDHDPQVISAQLLADALNRERFGAKILQNGDVNCVNADLCSAESSAYSSVQLSLNEVTHVPQSRFVESTFLIKSMNTFMDENEEIVAEIKKIIRQNFFNNQLRAFHAHPSSRTLKVEHDPDLLSADRIYDVLVRGLERIKCSDVELLHDGAVEGLVLPVVNSDNDKCGKENDISSDRVDRIFDGLKINVVISGLLWLLCMLSFLGESLRELKYAGIGSVLFGMPPVLMKVWMTIRRCQFDANCMMMIAAFGALALGEIDEAASVSFIFAISDWLEAKATGNARRALNEIISLRPEYAYVVDDKIRSMVIVPASIVPLGSTCSVRTGDKMPADGYVVEGSSLVDESSLTGEGRPVEKREGDKVFAGSINVGLTQLVIKTTTTVGDSTLSRLVSLVEEAQTNRSETEKVVDAFAMKYTPFVLVIAFFLCTVPWAFGEITGRYWALNGLIIIVIACPCALTISTPVTYSAGLAASAKRGIIIKGGNKLEALGKVRTVIFDKTGTLTKGKFSLIHLDLIGELRNRAELLTLLALMEAPSSHPLSAAIVSAAESEGIVIPETSVKEHTILEGEGISAVINGVKVYVGNERLFRRLDMYNLPMHQVDSAQKWNEDGGTVGYIGIEGEEFGIIGMFCVIDTIREEANYVVNTLLDEGVKVFMLTGDSEGAARATGKEIGLETSCIHSQLLPEDKLDFVSSLKTATSRSNSFLTVDQNLILMVGDGVNDAPALSVADVGVAMGQGTALAIEMSDVTLIDTNLTRLLFCMKMGAKVIATVKENIIFCILANSIAIILTFLGKMTLLLAIACDVGVMLLVTLNGMKLLSKRMSSAIEESVSALSSESLKDEGCIYKMGSTNDFEVEMN